MSEIISNWRNICQEKWESTWVPSKQLLQNTICADFGMWKGILNAKAKKEFNCKTIIGIESDPIHFEDCIKFNPGIILYKSIDQMKEHIKVDVIFMHGILCMLGDKWSADCKKLCEKIDADVIHVRHREFEKNTPCQGTGRETNTQNLINFNKSPSRKTVIDFFTQINFNLEKHFGEILIFRKQ